MASPFTQKKHSETVQEAQEQRRSARVHFGNPALRSMHVQAFFAWLPKILHDAPGICWESLPSRVMGYLIRRVANSPDAIAIALAIGSAMDGYKPQGLYSMCTQLTTLLTLLRRSYGMTTLAELSNRAIWDRFVEGRTISGGELTKLIRYETFACKYRRMFEERLDVRQKAFWQPYLLPPLPHGFVHKKAQRRVVESATQDRRKQQSDVILPLFPFLVEIAQVRKQAAERLVREFRRHRDRALTGELELPYHFQFVDHQFSVSEHATTLASVQLVQREVTLSLTLWDRRSWVKEYRYRYSRGTRLEWKQQRGAYATEHNMYFLQYKGPPGDLLWIGDLLEQQLLRPAKPSELVLGRSGLLSPMKSEAHWLWGARHRTGAMLFDPESLYRGVLFATALATICLTNGSRVSELLQVSASRFETIVVEELKNQQPTGRHIGLCVQKLLPKGYTHESERQFFLISEMAVRHLKEIAELLQAAHGGRIPVVRPCWTNPKADDLTPEPYLFQWAASQDGRLGHLDIKDVCKLLRFLFHGLVLTTRAGKPIRIAPHLLRHVLSTHARIVQKIPAEALAYLLHHRVQLPDSTGALTLPEATAYYSRLPVARLLALLASVQSTLMPGDKCSYVPVPSPQQLAQMDEALRAQFERCGMIGPTVLGFCSAGTCVRPDNRGICANCPFLVPHYGNLPNARIWRKLYVIQAKLHDDQGHTVDAEQARKVIQYLDDMIRIMEIQIRTRQDGGYIPFVDMLPPVEDDEGDGR